MSGAALMAMLLAGAPDDFGNLLGTFSGNATSISNPTNATGSVAVSVGDLVVAWCAEQNSLTNSGCSDNLGNTYTAINAGTDGGTSTGRGWYTRVTNAGTLTSISLAATASSNNVVVIGAAFKGPFATSPLDANPANAADNTSPFTCPATGTLAQATELVVAFGTGTGSTSWTATAPNTMAVQTATAAILKAAIGYQRVNSTASVAPAFTAGSNPTDSVFCTASFKKA